MTKPSHAEPWTTACQNCGTPLDAKFCPHCGQRAIPPRPTLRELAHDAWSEMVGWDGKVARTLQLLLLRPGELTVAVLEGRRARYISPVRLYLVCSLLYFLIAAGAPIPADATFDVGFDVGVDIGMSTDEIDPVDAAFAKAVRNGWGSLSAQEREILEAEIADQPAMLAPFLRGIVTDFAGFQRRTADLLPQALFLLIPVLALVLGAFYRGRHYPEHLYAALHLQSFVFLMLASGALVQYTRSAMLGAAATLIAAIVIVAYAIVAQRRVYGGAWGTTIAKAICIGAAYGLLWSATSLGVALWVASV